MFPILWKSLGTSNCLVAKILSFMVLKRKKLIQVLEQLESDSSFFGGTVPLRLSLYCSSRNHS